MTGEKSRWKEAVFQAMKLSVPCLFLIFAASPAFGAADSGNAPGSAAGISPARQAVAVSSASRVESIQAAIRGHDLSAAEGLIAAFSAEPSGAARAWIVRALSRLDYSRGLPVIEAGLKDRDPEVRLAAADMLGQRGGKLAHADLAAALGSEASPGVRATIAFWLGSSEDPAATAALDKALSSDPDPNVRVQAAQSLKRAGTPAAKKSLENGLKDSDERVRRIAR